jgi:hypothetical protein
MAPCPREISRQIELLRVGTADPAWCINRSIVAAFAHPTAPRRWHRKMRLTRFPKSDYSRN